MALSCTLLVVHYSVWHYGCWLLQSIWECYAKYHIKKNIYIYIYCKQLFLNSQAHHLAHHGYALCWLATLRQSIYKCTDLFATCKEFLRHPLTHSPPHSLARSLTHSHTHSLTHPPIHSLTHPSATHQLTHSLPGVYSQAWLKTVHSYNVTLLAEILGTFGGKKYLYKYKCLHVYVYYSFMVLVLILLYGCIALQYAFHQRTHIQTSHFIL